MKHANVSGVFMLLLTALIWGTAFVAQSVGMQDVDAFTFSSIRTLLGALVLLPVVLVNRARADSSGKADPEARKAERRKTLRVGLLLGVIFCAANNIQQFAFRYSSAGKIAFITALYIFFVPLLGLLFHKRVSTINWLCAASGILGLYFLSIQQGGFGGINRGDLLALLCSVLFSFHIIAIDRFAADMDSVTISCLQFGVSGILSGMLMFLFEAPKLEAIRSAAVPILYAGVLSCGLAYTFQILGQKTVNAALASLLLSLESVFAVLASSVILHEAMTARETAGCVIMFLAILLSQLHEVYESRKAEQSP